MGLITLLFLLLELQVYVGAQNSSKEMDLEDLKRLCYPGEHHMPHVSYIKKEPHLIGSYLNTMDCTTSSLHVSVDTYDGYKYNEITLDHLYHCNLTEFWLVAPQESQALVVKYKRFKGFKLHTIQSFHIKLPLDSAGDLASIITDMPNLRLLELAGNRRLTKTDILRILEVLQGKPLNILKLNGFQFPSGLWNEEIIHTIKPQYFQPISSAPLMCLELSDNYITEADYGLFDILPHVRILNVSYNYLDTMSKVIGEVLLNPVLEVVDISGQGYRGRFWDFSKASNTPSENDLQMRFRRSELNNTNGGTHQSTDCELVKGMIFKITDDPGLFDISCGFLPSLLDLSRLVDVSCSPPLKIPIGKKLKVIKADFFMRFGGQFPPNVNHKKVCFHDNSLTTISVAHSSLLMSYGQYSSLLHTIETVGLNYLKNIDFSYNRINIIFPDVLLFRSIPNLEKLFIQGNNITFNYTSGNSLCDIYPHLEELNLAQSNISSIDIQLFKGCNGSLKLVDLQDNIMADIFNVSSIASSFYIDTINLTRNKIKFFSKNTLEHLQHFMPPPGRKMGLDLTSNEFLCDCSASSLGTIKLIQNADSYGVNFVNRKSYVCLTTYHTGEHIPIMDINVDEVNNICFPSHTTKILLITTIILAIVTVACIITLLWKYRFRAMTMLYRVRMRTLSYNEKNMYFKYDAFVAYCSKDRIWVHNVLRKSLEETYGFELCIHYRYIYLHLLCISNFMCDKLLT